MPIVQQGSINTTALVVPDLYVQIVPPQNLVLNGVPTNVVGVVGSAAWGPVGQPVIVASMADYARNFGPLLARKYDMGTQVATAVQQGAADFRCVRATDGTDTAAAFQLPNTSFLFTALYTGSLGNRITVAMGTGSKAGTWRLAVTLPGFQPEVFDNIGGTGAAFWQALAAAVNNGLGPQRGPSQIVVASAGTTAVAPVGFAWGFETGAPGSDGASGVTAASLVGVDTAPRQGMYALRGQRCSIAVLADADDATQYTPQAAFGLSEGIYMILVGPVGDTIGNAVSVKQSVGLDAYSAKLMFGDWIWWNDQVNQQLRLVSPQGFVAGRLANLSPEQSSLNKPLYGVIGSQKSGNPGTGQITTYSAAELGVLLQAGIDVIANPQPAGSFWGVRGGHNASSNAATSGDNYTRLTNYIAATLAAGMGQYVGQVINAGLFRRIRATQLSFLQNMLAQGLLGSTDGALPFSVICDATNNPPSRTGLGYVQSDAQVQYQAINEKFIVNMEGGQTVQVQRQTLPGMPGSLAA
ncbi:phage tail sheath protein [Limobrevibacterium gyesilva]|uniref:Phage tail protein n=1 Tax=Limobrevibacterium gyesilva TaxID=2991712 RepID=A0AA41YWH5_9PROT|nr:phage tail protein [Limobrevibacterium gyesilva]MCW3477655.1 phage tail protein [Limobrevibacterium gyesilva]